MTKAVLLIGIVFAAAACDVGSVPAAGGGGGGGGGVDAPTGLGTDSGSGGGSALISPGSPQPRSTNVQPAHQHAAGGTNAGIDCMQCHAQGGTAGTVFQIAGTLYGPDGTTPDPGGAAIEIQPNGNGIGPVTLIHTDNGGNFYVGIGEGDAITNGLPCLTWATASPSVSAMTDVVTATGGGCNSCHSAGNNPGPMMLAAQ